MIFVEPEKIVESLDIYAGMKVADFGVGSGRYTLALARAVGEKGRVYAVDIQKELLQKIDREAGRQGFENVEILWGDMEKAGGTKLPDGLLDAVLLSNVLFQLEQRDTVAKEIARVLKPGGRAVIIDWSGSYGHLGPRPEDVVSADSARELFEGSGFAFEKEIPAGRYHYGLVFKK